MSSINTNVAAMTALQSLAATNKNLTVTQGRISTGLRVGEAADNAAYWSIATTMRSDNKALSTVQDALGLGAGKIDTAYTAMNKAIEVVDDIKQKLVSALGASDADKEKINTEIKTRIDQLKSIAVASNYAGSNLLATGESELSVVGSYNRAADGTTSVGFIKVDLTNVALFGEVDGDGEVDDSSGLLTDVVAIDLDGADDDAIKDYLTDVETAFKGMASGAAELGAAKARIDMQKDFMSKLMDSVDRGVGQLVDADMNKESTRLQALQVQQQLGIQALSIANGSAQSILSLFRG